FVDHRIPVAILQTPARDAKPYALLRWLRNQERLAFVQVFIFATGAEALRSGDAIAAGADDFFDALHESRATDEVAERIVARIGRSQVLSELALLDPLTELHNRRFMNDRLPAEIARAARNRGTLSTAMIDLDDFKRINDTLGHAVGDRVLAAFARALRSDLRAYDLVCRFGGDEFVVLFPDCG